MTSVYDHNLLQLRVKDLELENADLRLGMADLRADNKARKLANDQAVGERLELYQLREEQENLRKANLHCVDMFNQIKADYDKVLAENEALKAKLEKEAFMGLFRDINQEIALLKAEQEILKAKSRILIVPSPPNKPPPFRDYT